MKLIPLGRGLSAMIDDEDFDLVSRYKWSANKRGHSFYARRTINLPNGRQKVMYMHILLVHGDIDKASIHSPIDHIDRNGLNNQRHNLRLTTRSVNLQNTGVQCNNKTGYKGVYLYGDRFRAAISKDKRQHYLGTFESAIDAAAAYDRKALELFWPHAAINFPMSGGVL